jgi:hypothetical protein
VIAVKTARRYDRCGMRLLSLLIVLPVALAHDPVREITYLSVPIVVPEVRQRLSF